MNKVVFMLHTLKEVTDQREPTYLTVGFNEKAFLDMNVFPCVQ